MLVRNLCVAREPIYGLAGWAGAFEPGLLGLAAGEAGPLNDDRVGRALEKRHHQLKSVHDAAPVTLKSPARIETLFACQFIALLCCCLIERELRNAMAQEQITELPLYPEDRSCTAPTATRVFDHLAPLQRHHLIHDEHIVQTFQPQLTPLQAQLLDLVGVCLASRNCDRLARSECVGRS